MILLIIVLFALAAVMGAYLISFVFRDKNTPKGIAFIHGPVAALALILLIIYSLTHTPAPILSIVLFVIAAIGGTILIVKDLTGQKVTRWLAATHGTVAVLGFLSLLLFVFYH